MRARTTLAASALASALLAGCGHAPPTSHVATDSPTTTTLPTRLVGNVEVLKHGSLGALDIASAERRFALDLMAQACGKNGPNTLLSPASAFDALGLLDASTAGQTSLAVARLLHLPVWSPAVVAAVHDHRVALARLASAGNDGLRDTLRSSNRVWPADGNQPTARYLDDVRTAYGATVQPLDYARHNRQATDTINRQVGKDTAGLIPRLFGKPLDKATVAVLTNAIALKATWRQPFLLRKTTSAFVTAAGTKQARLMDSAKPADYASAGGWQAAKMTYRTGTMEAVAILPPTGSAACALPTVEQLNTLTEHPSRAATTDVVLPQLHLDQGHDLLTTLARMGLPLVGQYPGLGGSEISAVVQKDMMTLDELGTVAAGATGVEVEASAEGVPDHRLTFDRPFLLVLQDMKTHTPLFLAAVSDPSAS